MRFSIAFILLTMVMQPVAVYGQAQSTASPRDEPSSIVVIDTPPPPQAGAPQVQTPSTGVVLEQPGRVLISGTPVRAHFRSPTDGVSFQLRMGGSYSSISGVTFGVGYGGYGWGYGGYGGYGAAPYYGEVVTKAYQPICETPCDATLLSGRHRMALSLNGGKPVDVAQPIDLSADAIVEGRYVDKGRMRKAGWATFVAGSIAGLAMMFASVSYNNDPFVNGNQIRNSGVFYTGVGLFVSSIVIGAVLASQNDEAYVNVFPVE